MSRSDLAAEASRFHKLGLPHMLQVQFCGHAIHFECFQTYFASAMHLSETNSNLIFDAPNGEFLCPLCRRLSNALVPACEAPQREPVADMVDGCSGAGLSADDVAIWASGQADDSSSASEEGADSEGSVPQAHELAPGTSAAGPALTDVDRDLALFLSTVGRPRRSTPSVSQHEIALSLVQACLDALAYSCACELLPAGASRFEAAFAHVEECMGRVREAPSSAGFRDSVAYLVDMAHGVHRSMAATGIARLLRTRMNRALQGRSADFLDWQVANESTACVAGEATTNWISAPLLQRPLLPTLVLGWVLDADRRDTTRNWQMLRAMFVARAAQLLLGFGVAFGETFLDAHDGGGSGSDVADGSSTLAYYLVRAFTASRRSSPTLTPAASFLPPAVLARVEAHLDSFLAAATLAGVRLGFLPANLVRPRSPGAPSYLRAALSLPSAEQLLASDFARSWLAKLAGDASRHSVPAAPPNFARDALCSLGLFGFPQPEPLDLIRLPTSYARLHSTLMTAARTLLPQAQAPPGEEAPDTPPAQCLMCGAVLRAGDGDCTNHVKLCSAGKGAVFLLHDCSILIMSGVRSAYFPSPYVDQHGERNRLVRGKPLFLDPKRMEVLRSMIAEHRIASEVVARRGNSQRVVILGHY